MNGLVTLVKEWIEALRKPNKCPYCSLRCKSKPGLGRHLARHKREREKIEAARPSANARRVAPDRKQQPRHAKRAWLAALAGRISGCAARLRSPALRSAAASQALSGRQCDCRNWPLEHLAERTQLPRRPADPAHDCRRQGYP